jgi:7-cyano-7-deazaguanine synthase
MPTMPTRRGIVVILRSKTGKFMANERKYVIVLSGGMDSTTLLYDYKDEIALAVTFDYGSNHNAREIACARENCAALGIEHIVIPLAFMQQHFHSSLLEGADAIPEGHYADDNMRSTVVPFRNGIMLAIACGMAESRGLTKVLIANHSGDHAIYPDCRSAFINAMSEAMKEGTYEGITILAPYTNKDKTYIARRGAEVGVDFAKTYSCYKGGEHHCGRCGTCVERHEAFRLAGLPDPTIYDNAD